jgi:hypothetical protein
MSHAPDPTPVDPDFVYPPPHPRRPLVLGLVGIVAALFCPPLGIGLGAVSIAQVRKDGGRFLWGILAIIVNVVSIATAAALWAHLHWR